MSQVTQKREIGLLDGKPEKRMFWSIISDYDITTALCELIDNAIDIWFAKKPPRPPLNIDLSLDAERQLIQLKDNAGGVSHEDLRLLIAPGASKNDRESETIGYFGVGSKRAVVALAENIIIKTRCGVKSFQIDITKEWLSTDDWDLPHFEIPGIDEGCTIVDLSSLRKSFSESDISILKRHIGETYEWFLQIENLKIKINGEEIQPLAFDAWAYPSGFEPRRAEWPVEIEGQGKIRAEIVAGLITDRDPVSDNYGVYFYCNNRLVVKDLKTRDVGYFVTGEAGVPHPDISLCRAIVRLNGAAKLMPWISNKSGIHFSHPSFQKIRTTLIQLLHHFGSLSRRTRDDWEGKVFKYKEGKIVNIEPASAEIGRKLILPPLPKVHKTQLEMLKAKNKDRLDDEPWTLGLIEAVAAVEIINSKKLETKNRIALILLDSNFEIALKEFIVHRHDLFPPTEFDNPAIHELFQRRHKVINAVTKKVAIPQTLLDKTKHYYELRNKLIHERATAEITDRDVEIYQDTIQKILNKLFDLNFEQ